MLQIRQARRLVYSSMRRCCTKLKCVVLGISRMREYYKSQNLERTEACAHAQGVSWLIIIQVVRR